MIIEACSLCKVSNDYSLVLKFNQLFALQYFYLLRICHHHNHQMHVLGNLPNVLGNLQNLTNFKKFHSSLDLLSKGTRTLRQKRTNAGRVELESVQDRWRWLNRWKESQFHGTGDLHYRPGTLHTAEGGRFLNVCFTLCLHPYNRCYKEDP